MSDKYDTCSRLELGTLPPNITYYLVGCKWIFYTKYLSNGSIDRYNACLIVKRFRQCLWFNHHDILGLVVKLTAIWFIFTLPINYGCSFDNLKSTGLSLEYSLLGYLLGHLYDSTTRLYWSWSSPPYLQTLQSYL